MRGGPLLSFDLKDTSRNRHPQEHRNQSAHEQGGKKMGELELLGLLAIVIGIIGVFVLLKSRQKSDR